jgi:bifunctional DNA-binding transcriptional regulator/antitoxin component of YhaV-PrlF toxin-antitoxin module
MHQASSKMHSGGRLVVPSHIREALHLNVGNHVLLRVEDGELRVIPRMEAIRCAQRLVAEYIPASVSLVDELIADRLDFPIDILNDFPSYINISYEKGL